MVNVSLANFNIRIDNRFEFTEWLCRDYLTDATDCDLFVRVSDEALAREREMSVEIHGKDHPFSPGYLESICIYRELCERLIEHGAFMLHAATVELDGHGYAFSARPGVGKSTHAALWRDHLGATVINGDKPLVTFDDSGAIAWGTPWCGKEGQNVNRSVRLDALCFIERSSTNSLEPMSATEAAPRLMTQLLLPSDPLNTLTLMGHADRLLRVTPCFRLGCNMSPEAATVCRDGIRKHNQDRKDN